MYEESGYFDPNPAPILLDGELPHDATSINSTSNGVMEQDSLRISSGFSLDDIPYVHSNGADVVPPMGAAGVLENLQHQLGFDVENELQAHLMLPDVPPMVPLVDDNNINGWVDDPTNVHPQGGLNQQYYNTDGSVVDDQQYHHGNLQNVNGLLQNFQCYTDATTYAVSGAAPPDLLNLLHLPRCNIAAAPPPILPTAGLYPTDVSSSFASPGRRTNSCFLDVYGNELPTVDDGSSLMQIGYPPPPAAGAAPPQSHLLRDLFQSLPQNYGLYGLDDGEGGVGGGVLHEENGRFDNPVFDFRRDVKGDKGNFATEKQRRQQMNSKYDVLKSLIPNLSKTDRASVVMGAIEYIHELQRTVSELKHLIEKKRQGRHHKRLKTTDDADAATLVKATGTAVADVESSSMRPLGNVAVDHDFAFNDNLRSSWLQRKSRETFVDVRIVDDEVNVKLTQKKKPNCLLLASKALHDLQLDVIHVSAGFIGEHHIFLFNTKIFDGSSVYASAIAKKMLEAMDRPYLS